MQLSTVIKTFWRPLNFLLFQLVMSTPVTSLFSMKGLQVLLTDAPEPLLSQELNGPS